jgi:hypothetical protein
MKENIEYIKNNKTVVAISMVLGIQLGALTGYLTGDVNSFTPKVVSYKVQSDAQNYSSKSLKK